MKFDIINKISIKELNEMFSILKENYAFLYNITDKDYLKWTQNILNSNDINTYILKEKNKIIAYIQFIIDHDYICISEIQISKSYQGNKKTLKKLLNDFISLVKIEDNTIIYININPNNIKSIKVFEHYGFKLVQNNRYEILGNDLIKNLL